MEIHMACLLSWLERRASNTKTMSSILMQAICRIRED